MRTSSVLVIFLAGVLIAGVLPGAIGHLAQNPSQAGSWSSAGFGGPALDADPCRRNSTQDALPGSPHPVPVPDLQSPEAPVDATCDPHNGVSGTYLGTIGVGVVECLNVSDPGWTEDSHGACAGTVFTTAGWGHRGIVVCDLEFADGAGLTDEPYIDNGNAGGNTPDGTWDDGGLGGACHVSTYHASAPPNANTDPSVNGPTANNAPTDCHGTVYAEDWVLGADVPIVVGCDAGQATSGEEFEPSRCISPPSAECLVDEIGEVLGTSLPVITCAPEGADGVADTTNLGKGGGHYGDGVTVPAVAWGCTHGDIIVYVPDLISANPFGNTYEDERDSTHGSGVDEHFGWPGVDADAQILSDWDDGGQAIDGTGDTIVYTPTGGWIDHFFDANTSPDGLGCHGTPHNDGGIAGIPFPVHGNDHSSPGTCG